MRLVTYEEDGYIVLVLNGRHIKLTHEEVDRIFEELKYFLRTPYYEPNA